MAPQVWFITGASRGMGRSLTELVLKNGDIVVAAIRNPAALQDLSAKYPTSQFLVIPVDVTRTSDIKAAFAQTIKAFSRIDIVFNCAAAFQSGEAEAVPEEAARKLFDVNFWGAANVTLESIKVFRDINQPQGGRLITISSATGFAPLPGVAYYVASKFGIEGFTEAVRMELDPSWNIKMTVIEPGGYATGWEKGVQGFPHHPAYNKPHMPTVISREKFKDFKGFDGDPEKAVKVIYYKLAKEANPPKKLPLGADVQAMVAGKLKELNDEVEQYKSWSDGLKRTDPPLEF